VLPKAWGDDLDDLDVDETEVESRSGTQKSSKN
jgi:hypothetical protein